MKRRFDGEPGRPIALYVDGRKIAEVINVTFDDDTIDPPRLDAEDVRLAVEEAEPEHEPHRLRVFDEHGQRWAECLDCGRQWGAHLAEARGGEETIWLDEVSAGDGSCSERRRRG